MFGYVGVKHIKIYRPHSKIRFLNAGERGSTYVFGLDRLPMVGEELVLTGGEKDVLALSAKGFNAIALNSETASFPQGVYDTLQGRFEEIYVCYDVDDTGTKAARQLKERYPNIHIITLPLDVRRGLKDVADFF